MRNAYRVEREILFPQVVFEFSSPATGVLDRDQKQAWYQTDFKVEEYFRFDPMTVGVTTRWWGVRREDEGYGPIPDVNGRLYSRALDLEFEGPDCMIDVYRKLHELRGKPETAVL